MLSLKLLFYFNTLKSRCTTARKVCWLKLVRTF